MSRRKPAVPHKLIPDPLCQSQQISKFINYVMHDGEKSTAENLVYDALDFAVEDVWEAEKDKFLAQEEAEGKPEESRRKVRKPGSIREDGFARDIGMRIFNQAIENVMPQVEVRSRRVGGAAYQIPVAVRPKRRLDLAMRWLVHFSRASRERYKGFTESLARELLDAYRGRGNSVKKRDEMHRMAKSNQTFAHYRW